MIRPMQSSKFFDDNDDIDYIDYVRTMSGRQFACCPTSVKRGDVTIVNETIFRAYACTVRNAVHTFVPRKGVKYKDALCVQYTCTMRAHIQHNGYTVTLLCVVQDTIRKSDNALTIEKHSFLRHSSTHCCVYFFGGFGGRKFGVRGTTLNVLQENLFYAFYGFIATVKEELEERRRAEEMERRDAVEFALRNEVLSQFRLVAIRGSWRCGRAAGP
eukprot:3774026-Amphidinium_carterae.1